MRSSRTRLPSFLVTLEVTPEQATRLVHGINNYTLYAGLRGSEVKVDPKLSVNDLTIAGRRGQVNILWDADPTALERYRFALGADTQALDRRRGGAGAPRQRRHPAGHHRA